MEHRLKRLVDHFDRWAGDGLGEAMGRDHTPVFERALRSVGVASGMKCLDLGCGIGWASRLIARSVADVEVIGVDVSPRMIEIARGHPENTPAVSFRVADAHHLPFGDHAFQRVVSVETLYYYPDALAALRESARVLDPGGSAAFLLDYYLENRATHGWAAKLPVALQLLSQDEWCALLEEAGFVGVRAERVRDPRPLPDRYDGEWFDGVDGLRAHREQGSLLLRGEVELLEDEAGDDDEVPVRRARL